LCSDRPGAPLHDERFLLGLIYGFLVLLAETQRESRPGGQKRNAWSTFLITFVSDLFARMGLFSRQLTFTLAEKRPATRCGTG
jgi:hypothetical protein